MQANTFIKPSLNWAVSSYSDHGNGSPAFLHLRERFNKAPTTWLTTPWRCNCHKYLFRGSDFHTAPPTQMRGVSCPPVSRGDYPAVDLHSGVTNPRMEAPIIQEHPITQQKEPRTPYQQKGKVPPYSLPGHLG